MAVQSATRIALANELRLDMTAWSINLSLSQFNAFIAHIEGVINSNSATVLADVIADLSVWPEPIHTRHT